MISLIICAAAWCGKHDGVYYSGQTGTIFNSWTGLQAQGHPLHGVGAGQALLAASQWSQRGTAPTCSGTFLGSLCSV